MQGGGVIGDIRCRVSDSIWQLKENIEQNAGLTAETLALYQPTTVMPLGEHESVLSCRLPAELYAVVLQKIDVAAVAGVARNKLTDAQLEALCMSAEANGDIVILQGCSRLRDLSCLALMDQMQVLDVSGCNPAVAKTLAPTITDLK